MSIKSKNAIAWVSATPVLDHLEDAPAVDTLDVKDIIPGLIMSTGYRVRLAISVLTEAKQNGVKHFRITWLWDDLQLNDISYSAGF